jgi:CubicO group peptidase (beta-lactamase class C family)
MPFARVAALVGLAGLLVLGAVGPARSQTPLGEATKRADVDKIFAKWIKRDSPGCALAVIRNGSIVYKRGYGMADLDHNIRIDTATVFHAASLSKQFTAMAIMLLVKQGRLSLDDDVRTHLTELPDLGVRVTVGHLLRHTSGLRDQWDLVTMAGWRLSDDVVTRADVFRLVSRMKALNFRPGDQYLYSNTGFTLAAAIVERVSGQSLREFAKTNIFQPLGMARTVFRETHGLVVQRHAYGYKKRTDGRFEVMMPNYDLVGPTNLLTTVEDLARWDRNFDVKTVGGDLVLAQMQAPGTLNNGDPVPYGLGLMLSKYRGRDVVEHNGRDPGYRSHLIRFPDQRFAVACLCNLLLVGDSLPGELVRRVADIYLAKQLDPILPPPAPLDDLTLLTEPELDAKVGAYWNASANALATVSVEQPLLRFCVTRGLTFDCDHLVPRDGKPFAWINDSQPGKVQGEVQFEPPAGDAQAQLTLRREGERAMVFEKMQPATATPADLAEYAGRYYSEEIDTAYAVSLEGPSLVIKRQKYPDTTLVPAFRDGFTALELSVVLPFVTVGFTRDAQSRVTGFLIDGGNTRSFRFVRDPVGN